MSEAGDVAKDVLSRAGGMVLAQMMKFLFSKLNEDPRAMKVSDIAAMKIAAAISPKRAATVFPESLRGAMRVPMSMIAQRKAANPLRSTSLSAVTSWGGTIST